MDWATFFDKTRIAAGAKSFTELAPKLGVTDGAISHYRTGKRVPSAWTVAACLKIQGVKDPEKQAAKIMVDATNNAQERAFWRRFAAAAAVGAVTLCAMQISADGPALLAFAAPAMPGMHIM